MKLLIITFLSIISFQSNAQWKSYRITSNKDTINCVDKNDLKQGRWSIKIEGLRGEPGRDEEGVFKDGKKEGVWRIYTTMGDLYAVENYRWGNKDGKSQYFNITGIIREESWKSVNPANPYDTIDVYDPVNPNKMYRQIVKLEGNSVKHGTWKYYEDGLITRSENYILDKRQENLATGFGDENVSSESTKTTKVPAKAKPKEVLEFEKKVGKKKVKVIDGTSF
jgi:antitoxin component YwqK of YwqJK toxin-antitoxin module